MKNSIRNLITRSQRGFTLLELLAVMAIISVLATITATSTVGLGDQSRDTTAAQDGTTTQTTAGSFFSDRGVAFLTLTEVVLTTKTTFVPPVGETPPSFADPLTTAVRQVTSSRWPELAITEKYPDVFNTTSAPDGPLISTVRLLLEGNTDLDEATLLSEYTGVDFNVMISEGYSDQAPASTELFFSRTLSDGGSVTVPEYLWLFRKLTSSTGIADDSRTVVVFKLTLATERELTTPDSMSMRYVQIF